MLTNLGWITSQTESLQIYCTKKLAFSRLSVQINQRYSFLFWKLLSLHQLSLTRFSTLGGKKFYSVDTEHGDLLFVHSCQSDRSNGVYTFLMPNRSITLDIDCSGAKHSSSHKMKMEFQTCLSTSTFPRKKIKVLFDRRRLPFRPRTYRGPFHFPFNW